MYPGNWRTRGSVALIAPLVVAAGVFAAQPLSDVLPTLPGWHQDHKGSETILTPNDLAEGDVFYLSVKNPVSLKRNTVAQWFASEVAKDEKGQGKVLLDRPTQNKSGILTRIRAFEDKEGHRFVAFYIGVPTPNFQARLIRGTTSPQPEVYQKYVPAVRQFTVSLARQSGIFPPESERTLVALAEGL